MHTAKKETFVFTTSFDENSASLNPLQLPPKETKLIHCCGSDQIYEDDKEIIDGGNCGGNPLHEEQSSCYLCSAFEDFPPEYVIITESKKVRFDEDLDIWEYDTIMDDIDPLELWYSDDDISAFMDKRESKSSENGTSYARTFNHRRRVLLHYNALKETGSKDMTGLAGISEEYSRRSKAKALKRASSIADEVRDDPETSSPFSFFGAQGHIADFYVNSVLDIFNETSIKVCKSPLWVSERRMRKKVPK